MPKSKLPGLAATIIVLMTVVVVIAVIAAACAPSEEIITTDSGGDNSIRKWSYGQFYRVVDTEFHRVCYGMDSGSIVCYDTTP